VALRELATMMRSPEENADYEAKKQAPSAAASKVTHRYLRGFARTDGESQLQDGPIGGG